MDFEALPFVAANDYRLLFDSDVFYLMMPIKPPPEDFGSNPSSFSDFSVSRRSYSEPINY